MNGMNQYICPYITNIMLLSNQYISFAALHFMSLIDLFVFLLYFDGIYWEWVRDAFKEYYSYIPSVTEKMFPQISLSITNPKKNVYHVCKQRKRFFYFVTHLGVFTSGLRMRTEKENHIYLSIPFFSSTSSLLQSLIFHK